MTRVWLLQFTDLVSLMLAFFVLLYAMADPAPLRPFFGADRTPVAGADIPGNVLDAGAGGPAIPTILKDRALPLGYLGAVIEAMTADIPALAELQVHDQGGKLVVSLPSALLFDTGSAQIGSGGEAALDAIADLLAPIRNRIEIHGHTDPRPVRGVTAGGFESNWELAFARAERAAQSLIAAGYDRPIHILTFGPSLAQAIVNHSLLPDGQSAMSGRSSTARRVDILIHAPE